MHDVSLFRLYLLRATYLLVAVGLGVQIWPGIINAPADLAHDSSVISGLLGGVALLALLGLRYPLKLLPLLLFELIWKTTWLLAFGLPHWLAGSLDGAYAETWFACLLGAIFLIAIPWPYVWRHYVLAAGDRWGIRKEFLRPDESLRTAK